MAAREHYRSDALHPRLRFDLHETSVSHLLRAPHAALGGRSYGAALRAAAVRAGAKLEEGVVELGGGLGDVAHGLLDAGAVPYVSMDLSPRLLAAQRARIGEAFCGVRADAAALPLGRSAIAGLFLANEVIADLDVCAIGAPRAAPFRAALAGRSPEVLVNVGALELVAALADALAPGALAVITEYGAAEVTPVSLCGAGGRHVEHTIRFADLEVLATALGLAARVVPLADWLEIDRGLPVASTRDLRLLRLLRPGLPVLAYTRDELLARTPRWARWLPFELPPIGSARWPDPHLGVGFAQVFQALILRRPR
jgi:SAM-dependent methyltransferase